MIRVVLVDDHGIVRQGLRTLLEEQADIVVTRRWPWCSACALTCW
jgi:DNA-binding NarL/FixJ family response regulator